MAIKAVVVLLVGLALASVRLADAQQPKVPTIPPLVLMRADKVIK
jgi:hypothetical protein